MFSTAAIPQFPDQSETHLVAFKEDITVALEVITGRPGPEAELLHQAVPGVGAVLHPELGGLAGSVPTRDLTGEVAEVPSGVPPLAGQGGEEALLQSELEADAALTVPLLTHLSALVALGDVVRHVLGLRTLGGATLTVRHAGAVLLGLAQLLAGGRHEVALMVTARPRTGAALPARPQLAAQAVQLRVGGARPGVTALQHKTVQG